MSDATFTHKSDGIYQNSMGEKATVRRPKFLLGVTVDFSILE
jgi:hypothetical protein